MSNKFFFDGFKELIQSPLEKDDPQSFEFIKAVLLKSEHAPADPFRFLIHQLINKRIKGPDSKALWQSILKNKFEMEKKLCRRVGIAVAALDYFETNVSIAKRPSFLQGRASVDESYAGEKANKESVLDICTPGNHLENLKKEMFRAKRYKHSLSVVMLDVDDLQTTTADSPVDLTEEVFVIIAKIIKKTIRIVDILSYYAENRFLIILPNTNKREAAELSERIRQNICERTKRIFTRSNIAATISVGQTMTNSNSFEIMQILETALEEGKKRKYNMVYSI
jgi:diguanylate cyclase (GGDEF)-like protein